MSVVFVQARLPCRCCFSRAICDCRDLNRGVALKEEHGEAVWMLKYLPFSQDHRFGVWEKSFFFCWKLAFFVSYLFPKKLSSIVSPVNRKIYRRKIVFDFFSYLFLISTVFSKEKKVAHWCSGLKALITTHCQTEKNILGFSFFAPLERICAVRGNLKGNQQSVVELNASPQKTK